eukprot:7319210-Prymnesium_polylepis.1
MKRLTSPLDTSRLRRNFAINQRPFRETSVGGRAFTRVRNLTPRAPSTGTPEKWRCGSRVALFLSYGDRLVSQVRSSAPFSTTTARPHSNTASRYH